MEHRIGELDSETRIAREDAAAARHLAAARDRDLADLTIKVDATRSAVNALGLQTRGQFDEVARQFETVNARLGALEQHVNTGFAEVHGKLDVTAAGQQQIVELLNTLIERE